MTDLSRKPQGAGGGDAHSGVPPGARPRATRKSQKTFERILEGAIDCFVEFGYHRTNMTRIAEKAGVTRGCMQYYFPTTEEVLEATAERISRTLWSDYSDDILTIPEGRARIEFALNGFLALEDERYFRAWLELQAAARTEPHLEKILDHWTRQAEAARERLDAKILPPRGDRADDYRAVADLYWLILMSDPKRALHWNADWRKANLLRLMQKLAFEVWGIPDKDQPGPAGV